MFRPAGVASYEFYNQRRPFRAYRVDGQAAIEVSPYWDKLAQYARFAHPQRCHERFLSYPIYPISTAEVGNRVREGAKLYPVSGQMWYDREKDRILCTTLSHADIVAYNLPSGTEFGRVDGDVTEHVGVLMNMDFRFPVDVGPYYYAELSGPCGNGYHCFRRDGNSLSYVGPCPTRSASSDLVVRMPEPCVEVDVLDRPHGCLIPDGYFACDVITRHREYIMLGVEVGGDAVPYLDHGGVTYVADRGVIVSGIGD